MSDNIKARVLMLKGEKGEAGTPTDNQVQASVDKWLMEHPEATTTVEDGSITQEKLSPDIHFGVQDGEVTEEKIAGSAVTTSKIADGSVTGAKIGNDVNYNIGRRIIGDGITSIVRISQAKYDILDPKDPDTIYVIDSTLPFLSMSNDAHFMTDIDWSIDYTYELSMRMPTPSYRDSYLHGVGGKAHNPSLNNSGVSGTSTYVTINIANEPYVDFGTIRTPSALHYFKRTPSSLYLDGVFVKDLSVGTRDISGSKICVGGTANEGVFEFFGLKVFDANGDLIHHLAPAKNGNTAYLIDKITGSYFYNEGTTPVVYGRGEV